jgi:hypothetical protein
MLLLRNYAQQGNLMKAAVARKPIIKIAVVESDPLRFVGFRALFDTEPEFELISAGLPEISTLQDVDLILLGNRSGQNLFDVMASLKATRPDLRIIVTGSGVDEETILKAIASGAKGYVDEAASPAEFAQAIRIVSQGSVWAPRRVLSMFIERQRDWRTAGHRRAYGESSCGEVNAQGGRAESDCALGARHYAFAGGGEVRQLLATASGLVTLEP